MISDRLKELLDEHRVKYEVIHHPVAYTAQEEAAVAHVPGAQWAKTVVVLTDGDPVLAVLPAHRRIDLQRFRKVTGADQVQLAGETQFRELYPDCELGAIPPFGNLYGQTTFVDEEMRRPPLHVTVVGARDDARTQELVRAALAISRAHKRVETLDRREGPLPNPDVEYPKLSFPAAFVCTEGRCSAPARTADELRARLARLKS